GAGSHPANNPAVGIPGGQRSGQKPAILSVPTSHQQGLLPYKAIANGVKVCISNMLKVVRMDKLFPFIRRHVQGFMTDVIEPATVAPEHSAVLVRHPCQLRDAVRQAAKAILCIAQSELRFRQRLKCPRFAWWRM